ncbi:MAG: CRISPR-associated protein Cas4 [Planctomycetota bacterium]
MYSEQQLLPISALQHLIFCERQCALIHVEQLWAENVLTVEGRQLHEKAHSGNSELRDKTRITRGLWLKSHRLGLIGQADIVEFQSDQSVVPIEYKRGKPKKDDSDRIQLCAQALCLEEMLDTIVESGALFYGKRQRRTKISFNDELRSKTHSTSQRLHDMIAQRATPTAQYEKKCDQCSLLNLCMPHSMRFAKGTALWNARQFVTWSLEAPTSDEFSIYGEET